MLSIIVPVYNAELYIIKCLESLKNQIFEDFEVLLVNDGSTDKSAEVVLKFAETDGRFKLLTKENGGPMSACNLGVKNAIGDYIGFVDSDDFTEPNMFSEMMNAITQANADICCCGYNEVYDDKVLKVHSLFDDGVYDRRDIETKILPILFSYCGGKSDFNRPLSPTRWSKIYRKGLLIDNMQYFNETIFFGEDLMMNAPVIISAEKIVMLTSKCLYNYVIRGNSLSGKYIGNLEKQTETLLEGLRQVIADKGASVCLDSFYRDMFSFQIKLLRNVKQSDKTKKEKLAEFKKILNSKYVKESVPYAKKSYSGFKPKVKYLLIKHKMKRLLLRLLA